MTNKSHDHRGMRVQLERLAVRRKGFRQGLGGTVLEVDPTEGTVLVAWDNGQTLMVSQRAGDRFAWTPIRDPAYEPPDDPADPADQFAEIVELDELLGEAQQQLNYVQGQLDDALGRVANLKELWLDLFEPLDHDPDRGLPPARHYSIEEAAKVAKLPLDEMRALRTKGQGPSFVKVKGRFMVTGRDLEHWLREQ